MTTTVPAAPAPPAPGSGLPARPRSQRVRLARLARRLGVRGLLGLAILAIVITLTIFGPLLAPHDPARQNYTALMRPPSADYLLGTDNLGRDVLSRIIYGAQASVQVGLLAVSLVLVLGILLGLPSGYYGGMVDRLIMGLTDGLLAFPALVLALSITAALGPGLNNLIVAIGITTTPAFARLLRGQVLTVREREFVLAARCIGGSDFSIATRHVFPNTISPLIVQFSVSVGGAILTEAALSFLGLGVQPPTPSWGSMLREGYGFMDRAIWFPLSAGAAITLTVLGASFVGDALRDVLDVRARSDFR
ncbi:MAG: ABC transporter permease [Chloroflexota bacterium]|nr:ABC transporter permease [Chloroflexota bacterium]